jgi:hypothetical protein
MPKIQLRAEEIRYKNKPQGAIPLVFRPVVISTPPNVHWQTHHVKQKSTEMFDAHSKVVGSALEECRGIFHYSWW